jgi:hypothetical protein
MGGWGSGSRPRSLRPTCDSYSSIRLTDLQSAAWMEHARAILEKQPDRKLELEIASVEDRYETRFWNAPQLRFGYAGLRSPGIPWLAETSLFVRLVADKPHFGGIRLWFVCPRCDGRCRVMYREKDTNARAFTCLRCARLVYLSQRLSAADRVELKTGKLLSRLVEAKPWVYVKPRGMHHRTFERIVREATALQSKTNARWGAVAQQIDKQFGTPASVLKVANIP